MTLYPPPLPRHPAHRLQEQEPVKKIRQAKEASGLSPYVHPRFPSSFAFLRHSFTVIVFYPLALTPTAPYNVPDRELTVKDEHKT